MKLNESCSQPNQIGRGRRAEPRSQVNQPNRSQRAEIRDQIGSSRSGLGAASRLPSLPRRSRTKSGALCSPSDLCPQTSDLYSLRRHTTFWSLTFNGQEACFDHEQGAYYVAYLLLNPPDEPIHGVALELKALTFFRQFSDKRCETLITDPLTGEAKALACDAPIVELNLCVEEADGLAPLRRKIEELEAILENDDASEPVKAEVRRELQEIYAYQKRNPLAPLTESQKAVRAVRRATTRFHEHLAAAVDAHGKPNRVLRSFAAYVSRYILIPTNRYSKPGTKVYRENPTGCFTYEPPPGVQWTA